MAVFQVNGESCSECSFIHSFIQTTLSIQATIHLEVFSQNHGEQFAKSPPKISFATENVLLGKPAFLRDGNGKEATTYSWDHATTAKPGYPTKAVDGNRDSNYFTGNSCIHADNVDEAVLSVYMSDVQDVSTIRIANREDMGCE